MINPKYWKQGYGTELLRLSLLKSQELIYSENVLLTCDDDNIGSIPFIELVNSISVFFIINNKSSG